MFKHNLNGKRMVYGPVGKGITASMEYTPIIYSHDGKNIVLQVIIVMVKDIKCRFSMSSLLEQQKSNF